MQQTRLGWSFKYDDSVAHTVLDNKLNLTMHFLIPRLTSG
jgi:hypothetical protein